MKVTLDTNVLLRSVLDDDPSQKASAARLLLEADLIAVPTVALCEFVWVLTKRYKKTAAETARAIRALVASDKVRFDAKAVAAGLSTLDRGGDFADGVIALEGDLLGGQVFATFDRQAARLYTELGGKAMVIR